MRKLRHTGDDDISDHTLCLDMHDALTGSLVASAVLTLHEEVLLEDTSEAFEATHKVLLCSARLTPPEGNVWPQTARMRVLALRARDSAVAYMFADVVQRSDAWSPNSSDDDDDDDDDDGYDDAEDDGSADEDEDDAMLDGGDGERAQGAAQPLQIACYSMHAGFAAEDGIDAFVKLAVHAQGRHAYAELRVDAFHPVYFHVNGLTKHGFLHFLSGLTWVTPNVSMTPRRVAVPPSAGQGVGALVCSAALAVFATPDLVRAIVACLPWNERAAVALTCSALAAAVHSPDEAWHAVLLLHTAPALAAAAAVGTALFRWRSLAASITDARLRMQLQKRLLERGDARLDRRWDRIMARRERSDCGNQTSLCRKDPQCGSHDSELAADDQHDSGLLSDFKFFVEVYAPTGATALQDVRLVFNAACTLPRVDASGNIGTGLPEATLLNSLNNDAGLFRAPELPESALGDVHTYPPRTVTDAARHAAEEWVKHVGLKLWVLRRSDGAVAHFGGGDVKASADSFLSPETTLEFCMFDLFDPLAQPHVSSTALCDGRRETSREPCRIDADVKLTWRLATGELPSTLALFPTASLSLSAFYGDDLMESELLEEQMAAMLSVLDWAL